jgi:uncharacterized protein (TIGR03083 family)
MTHSEFDPQPGDGPESSPAFRIITDVADLASDPAPAQMRASVLAAVRARTATRSLPQPSQVPEPAAPYATQIAELDALVAEMDEQRWATRVLHDWDVAGVLGHLFAVDALLAEALGVPVPPAAGTGTDVAERTQTAHRAFAGRPAGVVHAAWRGQAIAVLSRLTASPELTDQTIGWFGVELPVSVILLDRAAETWLHGGDIRTALGLPQRQPAQRDLTQLAQGGARLLPRIWPSTADQDGGQVLLRLRGDHPSDWVLDPATHSSWPLPTGASARAEIRASVTIDVLEFCYLLLGRRTPDDVSHRADGDPMLVQATLAAAAGFARL